MPATTAEQTSARTLIDSDLFDRLVNRIVEKDDIEPGLAERIMDQALAFLGTAAKYRHADLTPSPMVDIGWHTFILYTQDYAAFCARVAQRFIHHVPNDSPAASSRQGRLTGARNRTLEMIERAGYFVDPELWTIVSGSCKPGDTESGCCAASGKDGNENTENQTPPPFHG